MTGLICLFGLVRPIFANVVLDLAVTDKEGNASDTSTLTFDDRDAQLALPSEGAVVRVYLNGMLVFDRIVDTVRSSGTRGGGRFAAVPMLFLARFLFPASPAMVERSSLKWGGDRRACPIGIEFFGVAS